MEDLFLLMIIKNDQMENKDKISGSVLLLPLSLPGCSDVVLRVKYMPDCDVRNVKECATPGQCL